MIFLAALHTCRAFALAQEHALSDGNAIELQDVVKRFGDVYAVDHVSLQIRGGEFFSLLGPSGCGKTTTLRMIAGFEYPTSGAIRIQGREMASTPAHERPVNTVFQSYALFPHLSVEQNVAFGLEMKRLARSEIGPRVQAALEQVRLTGYNTRRPRQLSGGQQQRVALARALVNQPALLLLDEPLGALDQKLRKELQLELKALQRRVGITFIFVTHDQEEALTMSDRIAVMSQGKVLQVGTPTEIYERPLHTFVADFIGETNFVEGQVLETSDGYATVETSDGLRLRGVAPRAVTAGKPATLSIRPEKIRLMASCDEQIASSALPVRVELVSYIGSDTRITVRLNEQRTLDIWEQNSRSTLDRNAYWQPGEPAFLVVPPDNALVLVE